MRLNFCRCEIFSPGLNGLSDYWAGWCARPLQHVRICYLRSRGLLGLHHGTCMRNTTIAHTSRASALRTRDINTTDRNGPRRTATKPTIAGRGAGQTATRRNRPRTERVRNASRNKNSASPTTLALCCAVGALYWYAPTW